MLSADLFLCTSFLKFYKSEHVARQAPFISAVLLALVFTLLELETKVKMQNWAH